MVALALIDANAVQPLSIVERAARCAALHWWTKQTAALRLDTHGSVGSASVKIASPLHFESSYSLVTRGKG